MAVRIARLAENWIAAARAPDGAHVYGTNTEAAGILANGIMPWDCDFDGQRAVWLCLSRRVSATLDVSNDDLGIYATWCASAFCRPQHFLKATGSYHHDLRGMIRNIAACLFPGHPPTCDHFPSQDFSSPYTRLNYVRGRIAPMLLMPTLEGLARVVAPDWFTPDGVIIREFDCRITAKPYKHGARCNNLAVVLGVIQDHVATPALEYDLKTIEADIRASEGNGKNGFSTLAEYRNSLMHSGGAEAGIATTFLAALLYLLLLHFVAGPDYETLRTLADRPKNGEQWHV